MTLGSVEGELQAAAGEVRSLRGMLPICSFCKKIRDDRGYWSRIEVYFTEHAGTEFTHSLCPDCVQQHYGDLIK